MKARPTLRQHDMNVLYDICSRCGVPGDLARRAPVYRSCMGAPRREEDRVRLVELRKATDTAVREKPTYRWVGNGWRIKPRNTLEEYAWKVAQRNPTWLRMPNGRHRL